MTGWCPDCGEDYDPDRPCPCVQALVEEMESVYVIDVYVRADRSVRAPGEETGT